METKSSKWSDYIVPVLLVIAFGILFFWWYQPSVSLIGTQVEQIVLEPFVMPSGEEGAPKTEADLKGKITLISFWATWCGPCRKELPHIGAIANHFRDDPEFQIWTVLWKCPPNENTKEDVLRLFEQRKVALPVYVYFDLLKPEILEPQGVPTAFLIGPDGKIVGHWVGYNENLESEVETLVTKLQNETEKTTALNTDATIVR